MEKVIHSGDAYLRFDKITRRFEQWIDGQAGPAFGYSSVTISRRITQRFVELGLNPYIAECSERGFRGEFPLPEEEAGLDLDGLMVDQSSGRVKLGAWRFGRELAQFFLHWSHVLLYLLPLTRRAITAPVGAATLLYGVGREALFDSEDGSDRRFAAFCRNSRIAPLNRAGRLIVQSVVPPQAGAEIALDYCRHPLQCLLRHTRIGIKARSRLLLDHLLTGFRFLLLVLRRPLLVLLARDLAYLPMILALDRAGRIEAMVVTNSSHSSQPLWMREPEGRNFRVHMIWYSQNVIPFVFKGDSHPSQFPTYRHLCVDEHWVWTQAFANYLADIGISAKTNVVGPILWYLPDDSSPQAPQLPRGDSIKLAVFDVTPVVEEVASRVGYLNNYYNTELAIAFVEGVVEAATRLRQIKNRPVDVLLKCKREFNRGHDPRYLALLDDYAERGSIELISHQINLYSLLGQCDVAIVIPNSSPAPVAAYLGKKAIYFEPAGKLIANHEVGPNILSVSDRDSLLETLVEVIDGPV